MSITSQSLFSDMMSKSKRLDDRQKRLRLREKRLIQSAEKRRVTISDFFGESGQSQEPMMPKGFMGGDPLKIIKEFTGKNVSTREEGGPIEEGKPYLVGEKGPELIVPSESGNVIPNDEYSNLASSINQSVNKNRVKTVIQPVIQNQITQVPIPFQITQPVDGNVTRMKASQLPNNIAKLIQ